MDYSNLSKSRRDMQFTKTSPYRQNKYSQFPAPRDDKLSECNSSVIPGQNKKTEQKSGTQSDHFPKNFARTSPDKAPTKPPPFCQRLKQRSVIVILVVLLIIVAAATGACVAYFSGKSFGSEGQLSSVEAEMKVDENFQAGMDNRSSPEFSRYGNRVCSQLHTVIKAAEACNLMELQKGSIIVTFHLEIRTTYQLTPEDFHHIMTHGVPAQDPYLMIGDLRVFADSIKVLLTGSLSSPNATTTPPTAQQTGGQESHKGTETPSTFKVSVTTTAPTTASKTGTDSSLPAGGLTTAPHPQEPSTTLTPPEQGPSLTPIPPAPETTAPPAQDTRKTTAPPALDTHETTAPPAQDTRKTTAPPAQDTRKTTAPPAQDTHETTAPPAQDTRRTTAPPAQDTRETTAPPAQDTRETTAPAAQDTHKTTAPPAQDTHKTTVPPAQEPTETAVPTQGPPKTATPHTQKPSLVTVSPTLSLLLTTTPPAPPPTTNTTAPSCNSLEPEIVNNSSSLYKCPENVTSSFRIPLTCTYPHHCYSFTWCVGNDIVNKDNRCADGTHFSTRDQGAPCLTKGDPNTFCALMELAQACRTQRRGHYDVDTLPPGQSGGHDNSTGSIYQTDGYI